MDNITYFDYSKNNPGEMFDPFYTKSVVVIPQDKSLDNQLTKNNARLIDCITAFKVLTSQNYTITDQPIIDVVSEIVRILSHTPQINYSAFSQFFMVYSTTYDFFKTLSNTDKFSFVYEMLIRYCQERHDMYISHGYSNIILQVMSDNYSHKRKCQATIRKILAILAPCNLTKISKLHQTNGNNYYFLPDKGDEDLFDQFLKKHNVKMQSRDNQHDKYPDIVYNYDGEFYICELKTINGSGGGQNKQIVELAGFIRYQEIDSKFHYISYLDGNYGNLIFTSNQPKVVKQRNDIANVLNNNKSNYFVNAAGFKKLIEDIL